jgi:hypothetical protein
MRNGPSPCPVLLYSSCPIPIHVLHFKLKFTSLRKWGGQKLVYFVFQVLNKKTVKKTQKTAN